jgi:hypothetical protein
MRRNLKNEFRIPGRGSSIRILHLGNVANVARILSLGQRKLGHEARVIAVRDDHFKEEADEVLSGSGVLGWNLAMRRLRVESRNVDAVHIHGGIWASQLYYYVLKNRLRDAAWVVHLHGSETRSGKGLHHRRLADRILCATADLTRFVPTSTWMPNPVPLAPEIPRQVDYGRVVLGHFPSNRQIKGTDSILRALLDGFGRPEVVRHEGETIERWRWRQVEFLLADRISHAEVLRLMQNCDAVVDHLSTLGPVSLVSLEAMALGRAALSSYDVEAYPRECPVIHLTLENARRVLAEAVDDPRRLAAAGAAGRRYVESYHDPDTIAARTISVYEEVRAAH